MTKTHIELLRTLIAAQVKVIHHVDHYEDSGSILNQLDFLLNNARKLVKELDKQDKA